MTSKLERYIRFLPKVYKARTNPMIRALLEAWAGSDSEIEEQLQNSKAQLFVKTAEGIFLDRLASNFGVSRPTTLGLLDDDYQNLIPNLSLKAKQIAKSFYDTMDVFWGPLYSRVNITSTTIAPFNISVGDSFTIKIDDLNTITITAQIGDIAQNGAATAEEIKRILNRIEGITAEIIEDISSGDERINIRTNTPGARGSLEVSSTNSFPGLGFITDRRFRISDLPQRTVLYQINPGEIIIEIPAILPVLRRVLKGSHHFHSDSTIEPPVPPTDGIWQGSFIYSTLQQPFVATAQKATLNQQILKGDVLNQLTVVDSSDIPVSGGKLIFDFGKETQEQPVSYITVPNTQTILIDPGYTFSQNHSVGSTINFLMENQITPYKPRRDGTDLAIYFTSPAGARALVQDILKTLAAAGIAVNFLILLPEYKYLFDNPYES